MDFNSQETQVLINPRWSDSEQTALRQLAETFPLKDHFWIASSGTSTTETSSVKLVALSRPAILASAQAVNAHLQADHRDIWAQCLPFFHVGGVGVVARAFLTGSRVVDVLSRGDNQKDGNWSASRCYQLLTENKVTLTALVPAQIFDLVQLGVPAPVWLRAVIVGGAALAQDLYEKAVTLGWPLLPSFGMTECCSQIATAPLESWRQKQRDLKILSHIEARVSRDGFLEVRSSSLLTGYAQIQKGEALWRDPKIEGWFQTADQVEVQQSILRPLGRGSDFVKILGEGVNLFRLQEQLEQLTSLTAYHLEIVLVALPDPRRGHRICLVVSQQVPDDLIEELTLKFNERVAPYEKIQEKRKIFQIPRTALGKLSREELLRYLGTF